MMEIKPIQDISQPSSTDPHPPAESPVSHVQADTKQNTQPSPPLISAQSDPRERVVHATSQTLEQPANGGAPAWFYFHSLRGGSSPSDLLKTLYRDYPGHRYVSVSRGESTLLLDTSASEFKDFDLTKALGVGVENGYYFSVENTLLDDPSISLEEIASIATGHFPQITPENVATLTKLAWQMDNAKLEEHCKGAFFRWLLAPASASTEEQRQYLITLLTDLCRETPEGKDWSRLIQDYLESQLAEGALDPHTALSEEILQLLRTLTSVELDGSAGLSTLITKAADERHLPQLTRITAHGNDTCLQLLHHLSSRAPRFSQLTLVGRGVTNPFLEKAMQSCSHITTLVLSKALIWEIPKLPDNVAHLKLRDCPGVYFIYTFPVALETLSITNCPKVATSASFPNTLHKLELTDLPSLRTLPSFPEPVSNVELANLPKLKALPSFSPSLTHLSVTHCPKLKMVPSIARTHLVELTLDSCPELKGPENFSPTLQHLIMRDIKVPRLGRLPPGIHTVDISDCKDLKHVLEIPEGIHTFRCRGSDKLEILHPQLPKSMQVFDVSNSPKLKVLPQLNQQLHTLIVSRCKKVIPLRGTLPPTLQVLLADRTGLFDTLSVNQLPSGLRHLACNGNVICGDKFPAMLENLYLDGITKPLPGLNRGLRSLTLHDFNLSQIPELPQSLDSLSLGKAKGLQKLNLHGRVKSLTLTDVKKLYQLDLAGSGVDNLTIGHCPDLMLITNYPQTIKNIDIIDCRKLKMIPPMHEGVKVSHRRGKRS